MRVYIVWVKGKKVILKSSRKRVSQIPHEIAFLEKYSRNTSWHLILQLPTCASHVAFSREPLFMRFSRDSREIALIFIASLILHQLNTKSNTIKSHKIQETKLMQLRHFLLWNKTNIKYSCKSQLYNMSKQKWKYHASTDIHKQRNPSPSGKVGI